LHTVIPVSDVKTSGVLLRERGRFVFCYGPHASGGVYVYRIGGHREPNESPWACAAREAREEATAVVRQLASGLSVQTDGAHGNIRRLKWPAVVAGHIGEPERPLVVGGSLEPGSDRSTLFLAETSDECHPSDEAYGLVRLTPGQVIETVRSPGSFSSIEDDAEPQDPHSGTLGDRPIVLSSHLRALAFCLERGYIPEQAAGL
jgi:8-oxo-dGTP pyrophosphatase MutT (NUDIX family)